MNKLTALLPIALLLVTVLSSPTEARADAVMITGGSLFVLGYPDGDAMASFTGEGLTITMVSLVTAGAHLCSPSPCNPGTTINLQRFARLPPSSLGNGPATVDGVFYPSVYYSGVLEFHGSAVVPVRTEPMITFTTPFTFTGSISGYPNFRLDPSELLFERELSGQGFARITVSRCLPFACFPNYIFYEARYFFQAAEPIPEPATLILFGTGIAGVIRSVRRRRKAGKSEDE